MTLKVLVAISFILISLSLVSSSPAGLGGSGERGWVVLHKQVTAGYTHDFGDQHGGKVGLFATNHNLTVSIQIFNVGNGPAYNVKVSDPWPLTSSQFSLLSGSSSEEYEEILPGQNQTFNFSLVPSFSGELAGFPATVQYSPQLDNPNIQFGESNPMANMTIVSAELFDKITAKHFREWLIFLLGSGSLVVGPLVSYIWIQFNYQNGLPKAKSQ